MPSENGKKKTGSSGARSAKALQGVQRGGRRGGGAPPAGGRGIPWVTVAAAFIVVALVGGITVYLLPRFQDSASTQAFVPSATNRDPSTKIPGVQVKSYPSGQHAAKTQRVAYDESPPFGGPHDQIWATCTGVVYPNALRSENAVHSLEHGAVWITYNPRTLSATQVSTLAKKVDNRPFMLMSPYPGLDHPLSLQGWGRQLKLDDPADPRVDQFISAVRGNQAIYPEPGATCDTANPALFDPSNPPPAESGPLPADAMPMSGSPAATTPPTAGG